MACPHLLDDRDVPVIDGDGHRGTARLRTHRTAEDRYDLEVHGPWDRSAAGAADLFDALVSVRRALEPRGWRILVQGGRRETSPSGMQRDMAAGRRVYVLRPGQTATPDDVRDTSAAADEHEVGTVAEQEPVRQAWPGRGGPDDRTRET